MTPRPRSALIALARTRRMQRALAHAYIHRDAPMPTLRCSLGYMTSTACTTDEATALGHSMTLLGVARTEGVAYVVEELGADEAPIIYRLWLRGPRKGHLVPIHAWYEQCDDARQRSARASPTIATHARAVRQDDDRGVDAVDAHRPAPRAARRPAASDVADPQVRAAAARRAGQRPRPERQDDGDRVPAAAGASSSRCGRCRAATRRSRASPTPGSRTASGLPRTRWFC